MKPRILSLIVLFLLSGCASTPSSLDQAFSASQQVKGSVESIPASVELTWGEALGVLSTQGFIVQQIDSKNHIILVGRELRDQKQKDLSYQITSTLTFVPLGDQITRVMVAANETTELHRQETVWWHLLWLIPLFPIGTDYTTVVVDRDTVRSPQFYKDFFDALKRACEEKTKMSQPDPNTPAPTPAPSTQPGPGS